MSEENEMSIEITDPNMVLILGHIASVKSMLPSTLLNLTPGKRKSMLKMGDKTIAFCSKALEFATLNPNLRPPYVDLVEFKKDLDAVIAMQTILRSMLEITSKLDDSILICGKDAYIAALSIYKMVKDGALRNVSGAKIAETELSKRFPGGPIVAEEISPIV